MSARPTFRQADLTRALRASRKAGVPVRITEIMVDGSIRLTHGQGEPENPYETWKGRQNANSA